MTTNTPSIETMKARLVLALLCGGILWSIGMFLQERAAFEPFVLVVLSAASFWVQTGGRGFPMKTPAALTELVTAIRDAMGENLSAYVESGSRIWTLLQATAFGFVALGLRFLADGILPASAPDWLAPVLALSVLGFGFALLARRFAAKNPAVDRFRGVGEAARKLLQRVAAWLRGRFGVQVTMSLPPTVVLAITALVRAGVVEALKRLVLTASSVLFSIWIGVAIALVVVFLIAAPEQAKRFLGAFRPKNNKEDAESSAG